MDAIPADLETLVFEKSRLNADKLLAFGFSATEEGYFISLPFHDGEFSAEITVDRHGTVSGKVIETAMEEEYLPLRVASQTSAFVSTVRQEYYDLLCQIREEAFDDQLFVSPQANRIAQRILEEFGDSCDRPFVRAKDSVVFRVPGNQRWYGLVMRVECSKVAGGDDEQPLGVPDAAADEARAVELGVRWRVAVVGAERRVLPDPVPLQEPPVSFPAPGRLPASWRDPPHLLPAS